MKVGVDGVLLGCWADCRGRRALDVGTGCGVIALMVAQRNEECRVLAIDIHGDSVAEAAANFASSAWGERLESRLQPFAEMDDAGGRYDLIISNPPYFESGMKQLDDARKLARHKGELSPEALIEKAPGLLADGGRLSMVVPSVFFGSLREKAIAGGLTLTRGAFVRNHPGAPVKRVLMEFTKQAPGATNRSLTEGEMPLLTLFDPPGTPSAGYLELGRDFYLRF